ncbi:MAG: FAD:protein FMN transferase [Myxococcales bacterium]|nr:FAD:protein FMN transferase [Myxococcales bacterium]
MFLRRTLSAGTFFLGLTCSACTSSAEEQPTSDKPVAAAPIAKPAPTPQPSPNTPAKVVHVGDKVMGTVVDITMWTDDEPGAQAAAKAVFDEFRRVDALMSSWLPDSAVAQINNAAGRSGVVVGDELMELIGTALTAGKESLGAFDITVGAFRGLWKFDQDIDGTIPKKSDVIARTKLVSYKNVRLTPKKRTVKLARKGMRITLGGIAKGHAVDQSVAILRAKGYSDFIVQSGGDLFVSGTRGDRKWRVGIRDPRGSRDATFAVAEVANRTFSTSGDYERFVIKDGVRYHHLLDPATGRPSTRSRSVTVLAPNALTADIWSTALFVLGHERGMKIVETRAELDAVFVDKDNHVHISSGLQGTLRVLKEPTPGI